MLCKRRTSIKIKKRNEVFIGSKHENYYLVGVTNLCWQGEQTFGWGVYWEIIFPGGGMKKFPAGGRWGVGVLPPNIPVGKTLWIEFEKHGLHTLLQGLRISCKICLLH